MQEVRSTGRLAHKKIFGTLKPANALTKHVPGELLDSHLRAVGVEMIEIKEGIAETAPTRDADTPAYAAEWVEAVADERDGARRVTMCGKVRAISAAAWRRRARSSIAATIVAQPPKHDRSLNGVDDLSQPRLGGHGTCVKHIMGTSRDGDRPSELCAICIRTCCRYVPSQRAVWGIVHELALPRTCS